MKNVVILGDSGHAHVVADIVRAAGDNVVAFLDDNCNAENASGPIKDYIKYDNCEFIIGIGNTKIRETLSASPVKWYTAIHPSAIVSPSAKIGEGSVVMPNAVLNADSKTGNHCIINTSSVVEHDCRIFDYAHISVGARLGGNVHIGKSTWVGIGAIVNNNVHICGDCVIGAGAVVVKNISKAGTYIGIPAKEKN